MTLGRRRGFTRGPRSASPSRSDFSIHMRRFLPGPDLEDSPKWLRCLFWASYCGPLLLVYGFVCYGLAALIGEVLHLYHLPVGPELFESSWGKIWTGVAISLISLP